MDKPPPAPGCFSFASSDPEPRLGPSRCSARDGPNKFASHYRRRHPVFFRIEQVGSRLRRRQFRHFSAVSRARRRTLTVVGMVAWQPQARSTGWEPPRVFPLRLQHFALRFPLRLGILLHRLLLFPIRLAGSARLRHSSGARLSRGCNRETNTQRAQQDKGSKFFHNLGEFTILPRFYRRVPGALHA